MLVDLATILAPARRDRYAVVAPDFANLAMAAACVRSAEAARAPLILAYHTHIVCPETGSVRELLAHVRTVAERATVPVALHLDHGGSLAEVVTAIQAGCTSVMIDGSALPYAQNAATTARVVEIAHAAGVSVEAELGHVPSDRVYGQAEHSDHAGIYTDPQDAVRFVAETGVDALAVSVGTRHGQYQSEPRLDFDRLAELARRVPVPLVLHGSSGTGADNLRRAVELGIAKVNMYTEMVSAVKVALQVAAADARAGLRDIADAATAVLARVLAEYFVITRSAGRG